jgi:hypothetical protein
MKLLKVLKHFILKFEIPVQWILILWIFYLVPAEAQWKQCITFLYLVNFNLVNNLHLV